MDCGTIQGIFISPIRGRERDKNEIVVQTQILIDRLLANDVYINRRCISMRNHDIGVGLANQLINPSNTTNIYTNPLYLQECISNLSIMLWSEY
jgi:hypothetical protein